MLDITSLRRFAALLAIVLGLNGVALPTAYADHDEDLYGANNPIGSFFDDRAFWVIGIEANPTSNGLAVVAGAYCQGSDQPASVCLVGIDEDGHVDTSFGESGFVTHTPTDTLTLSVINQLQFDPQGRILVSSFCERYEGVIKYDYDTMDMCITRYLSDGRVDPSFGSTTDNVANAPMIRYQNPSALVLPDDGRIVAGGACSSSPCLVGFNADGVMDETFGDGEYETGGSWIPEFDDGFINDLALLPDGGYIGVGTCSDYDTNVSGMCVIAWNEDGTRRSSFADNGVRYFIQGENSWGESIIALGDGTTIAGGKCNLVPGQGSTPCLVATSIDGSAATSFGANGVVEMTDMTALNDLVQFGTVIFAVGQCSGYSGPAECVHLFDEDGSPTEQYVHTNFFGNDSPPGSSTRSPLAAVTVEHVWFAQPCGSGFSTPICLSRTRYHSIPVETATSTVTTITEEAQSEPSESSLQSSQEVSTEDETAPAEEATTATSADTTAVTETPVLAISNEGSSSTTVVVAIIAAVLIAAGAAVVVTKRRPTT
ncbi:MAG: hypothetical protein L7T83_01690 [Ilumatobacteraceae bacterium]|nr:hypothetical protein [Ilumatobacteraceae bacterium]